MKVTRKKKVATGQVTEQVTPISPNEVIVTVVLYKNMLYYIRRSVVFGRVTPFSCLIIPVLV